MAIAASKIRYSLTLLAVFACMDAFFGTALFAQDEVAEVFNLTDKDIDLLSRQVGDLRYFRSSVDGVPIPYLEVFPERGETGRQYPALILLGGSEPTSPYRLNWVFPLVSDGIAVYSVGDRGVHPLVERIWGEERYYEENAVDENVFTNSYEKLTKDVLDMIEHITADPRIDPTRVAICGVSEGGYMSLKIGRESPKVKAAFAVVPPLLPFHEVQNYPYQLQGEKWFSYLDKDGDGFLSLKEFKQEVKAIPEGWSFPPNFARVVDRGYLGALAFYTAGQFLNQNRIDREMFSKGLSTYIWLSGEEKYQYDAAVRKRWKIEESPDQQARTTQNMENVHANVDSMPGMYWAFASDKPTFIYSAGQDESIPPKGFHLLENGLRVLNKSNVHLKIYPDERHDLVHMDDVPLMLRRGYELPEHPIRTAILSNIRETLNPEWHPADELQAAIESKQAELFARFRIDVVFDPDSENKNDWQRLAVLKNLIQFFEEFGTLSAGVDDSSTRKLIFTEGKEYFSVRRNGEPRFVIPKGKIFVDRLTGRSELVKSEDEKVALMEEGKAWMFGSAENMQRLFRWFYNAEDLKKIIQRPDIGLDPKWDARIGRPSWDKVIALREHDSLQKLKEGVRREFGVEIAPDGNVKQDYIDLAKHWDMDLFHPPREALEDLYLELLSIPERFRRLHSAKSIYLVPVKFLKEDDRPKGLPDHLYQGGQFVYKEGWLFASVEPFTWRVDGKLLHHEWGHAVWGRMSDEQRTTYARLSWERKGGLFDKKWVKRNDNFLSPYSQTSVEEDFAEHFRFYINQPDDLKEKAPGKFNFFEELFR